jgi:uncharacterized protein YbaP (TraB family)
MSSILRRFAAVLAGLAAWATAQAAWADPPVWIVKSKTAQVVLFGSIHVLPPNLAWEPPALKVALAQATDVWFELQVDPQTEALTAQIATKVGVLAPDQSLFRLLPPEVSQRMSKVAETYQVSPVLLDRLQPWLAEIALAGAAYRKAGAATDSGVELTVQAEAPAHAVRHAFETPQEQLDLFSTSPFDQQVASLDETLKEMQDDPDEYMTLLKAWLAGDTAGLDREALAPLRTVSPDLFRRVVTERNAHWTAVLDQALKGRGRSVVVVGVGHLVGKDGVPARLRALGYSVEGP